MATTEDAALEDLPISNLPPPKNGRWKSLFAKKTVRSGVESPASGEIKEKQEKWSMGILNDKETQEVPGSVLLLTGQRNEPLGLRNAPARTSGSSLPSPYPSRPSSRQPSRVENQQKKTPDGAIILEPQPEDSHNDPLNWPGWRRDTALLSLGFFCMVGGGMTPILAAGFSNVASTFGVSESRVALTTGLYMMGLGVGSVVASPTAILFGKRPVYLFGVIMFISMSIWCATSPSFYSLLVARVFQGVSLSPVECLPSATIAEIFFLHERAYRIGIYTLLLLSGKNLVPLVSAAVIQSYGWRWVFWIVAMIGGFCGVLLFLFVPETFWDRTPRPKQRRGTGTSGALSFLRKHSSQHSRPNLMHGGDGTVDKDSRQPHESSSSMSAVPTLKRPSMPRPHRSLHVGFAPGEGETRRSDLPDDEQQLEPPAVEISGVESPPSASTESQREKDSAALGSSLQEKRASFKPKSIDLNRTASMNQARHSFEQRVQPSGGAPPTPGLHNFNSPYYIGLERSNSDYIERGRRNSTSPPQQSVAPDANADAEKTLPGISLRGPPTGKDPAKETKYTSFLREQPKQSFVQQLKPFNGRLHNDNWLKVAARPFILYAYPSVLWSAVVYACSVGWLIVISESVTAIFRSPETYGFSALSAGLVYISPFVGGILGTAVAGKLSDVIVRAMSRRNGGLYEPEFRLVMAAPVALTTVVGLMGYGWSAAVHDSWIVPTVFFGIISFGCSLGSTTAITFCVDSYRQYAGEALVTLNFTKNICHGLVFSLFFNEWLQSDGSKIVFIAIGIIQLGVLMFTIPMYMYGKRARMWTVRKNFMEKF